MAPEDGGRRDTEHRKHKKRRPKPSSSEGNSGRSTSHLLSVDALAQLNEHNARSGPSAPPPRSPRDEADERERRERKRAKRRESRAREEARRDGKRRQEEEELLREQEEERVAARRKRRRNSNAERKPEDRRRSRAPYEDQDDRDRRRSRKASIEVREKRTRSHDYNDDMYGHERERRRREQQTRQKRRAVSGAVAEEGRSRWFAGLRGGGKNTDRSYEMYTDEERRRLLDRLRVKKKRYWIAIGVGVIAVIILIAVAVVVTTKGSSGGGSSSNINAISQSSIPAGAPDYLNPFKWTDTTDFNLTYTAEMVGNLPIMGLNSTWDDSKAPNGLVPPLNAAWGSYAGRPARGVNLGGWLSLEPFITPDLFNYPSGRGIIDEYTLCTYLGSGCASTLENHYATFVTEATFQQIADAGLDHVRIPYSYWAVQTYDSDPYVFRTSWRYLLRGIEWARKHGLRVNLDLHALPGSQNGWNHSGRQGPIGWFNGTSGQLNVQRSIDVHNRLSQFFAQDRYKNIISHYGLANEPRMTYLSVPDVLNWTETTSALVRANGIKNAVIVFGDGFRGLGNWQGEMTGSQNLALDVHQYVIFNNEQIVFNHSTKLQYACQGWTQQTQQSMNTATGFGPTLVAEWSQADTDCLQYLNNVGWGNRWTGTYDTGNASDPLRALTPRCPSMDSKCSCDQANADPSQYSSDYKQFLLYFAEAQMDSFEKGWGWFYWTWATSQGATQWSYQKGMAAGILPAKAYDRTFHCNSTAIPSFSGLSEEY